MPGLRAIAQFAGLDILSSMPHLCFRNPLAMMVCATPNVELTGPLQRLRVERRVGGAEE